MSKDIIASAAEHIRAFCEKQVNRWLDYIYLEETVQKFMYKLMEDGNYAVMEYHGDEPCVTIPDSYGGSKITILYDKLFAGHTEITSVHIPDTVTDMGEFLFDGCTRLNHIELPKELCALWGYTFVRSAFEEIILPDKLASLPPFAFKDCKQLKRVVCGKGMKRIHAWVFGGCDQLSDLVHGPSVEISPNAFETKVLNT